MGVRLSRHRNPATTTPVRNSATMEVSSKQISAFKWPNIIFNPSARLNFRYSRLTPFSEIFILCAVVTTYRFRVSASLTREIILDNISAVFDFAGKMARNVRAAFLCLFIKLSVVTSGGSH